MLVETSRGKVDEKIYTVETFPYQEIKFCHKVRKGHKSYYNIPAAFDIETTSIYCKKLKKCEKYITGNCPQNACKHWIPPYAYMYHWQFCIDKYVIFGRRWEEFTDFIDRLHRELGLKETVLLPVYVHNLGYEFQFLRGILPLTEVFSTKERQPIRARSKGIEWRCSYKLSNMSLSKFCENSEGVIHYKGGDFDYEKIRTADTPLTESELSYCYNDVRGLCECIADKLRDDTVTTIPLTSTGYVRRECREAVLSNSKNKIAFKNCALDLETYEHCKEARRGGNTHANAAYAGQLLKHLISRDIQSSYPARLMIDQFPQRFMKSNPHRVEDHIQQGYAVLFRVLLKDVIKKESFGIPYLSLSKMHNLQKAVEDNGRILQADFLDMWVTDVDWKIIKEQYDYSAVKYVQSYIAKYDYLPLELRQKVMHFYELKTKLKGVIGKEYEYMKSKNKLNAIFGMMLTDIIGAVIQYEDTHSWSEKKNLSDKEKIEALERYYKNRRSFLSYQHGVWTTAHARRELERGLNICEPVYCDTDSCKTFAEYAGAFDKLNAQIMNEIDRSPLPPLIEHEGKTYVMGIWEDDGVYKKFITWGAKKYAFVKEKKAHALNRTHNPVKVLSPEEPKELVETVVAGLGKQEGAEHITEIGIENFSPGEIFFPSGRLTAVYNDDPTLHKIIVEGCEMTTASYMAALPGTYRLGITETYREIINIAFSGELF